MQNHLTIVRLFLIVRYFSFSLCLSSHNQIPLESSPLYAQNSSLAASPANSGRFEYNTALGRYVVATTYYLELPTTNVLKDQPVTTFVKNMR